MDQHKPGTTSPDRCGLPNVPDLRTQARVSTPGTEYRLDTLVPELMRRHNIDMWVLVATRVQRRPCIADHAPRPPWQSPGAPPFWYSSIRSEDQPVNVLPLPVTTSGFFPDPVGCSHPTRPVGTFRGNRAGTKSTPYCCKHLLQSHSLADGIAHTDL